MQTAAVVAAAGFAQADGLDKSRFERARWPPLDRRRSESAQAAQTATHVRLLLAMSGPELCKSSGGRRPHRDNACWKKATW